MLSNGSRGYVNISESLPLRNPSAARGAPSATLRRDVDLEKKDFPAIIVPSLNRTTFIVILLCTYIRARRFSGSYFEHIYYSLKRIQPGGARPSDPGYFNSIIIIYNTNI